LSWFCRDTGCPCGDANGLTLLPEQIPGIIRYRGFLFSRGLVNPADKIERPVPVHIIPRFQVWMAYPLIPGTEVRDIGVSAVAQEKKWVMY
jgi:hypothetical protein